MPDSTNSQDGTKQLTCDEIESCILGEPVHAYLKMSRTFLAQINFLDEQLSNCSSDRARRRKLTQARNRLCQEFAAHLDAGRKSTPPFYHAGFSHDHQRVWITLKIIGAPSKNDRKRAHDWMAARGISWNGDVKGLRREMKRALENAEIVPEGHFGFRVERTAEIGRW